jgi:membrane protease subunit HflC
VKSLGPLIAALFVVALIASGSLFTVSQTQNAIVFQLGEVKEIVTQPGLHFKWPLIQNVREFDVRNRSYDDPEPLRFITSEKKPVLVDSYVIWRIKDVREYFRSVQGDEFRAVTRLRQTISDALQAEFGRHTVHDVVSGQRDEIMANVQKKADQDLRRIGVEIVDVRLKRVDLPKEVSASVYRRMEAERQRVANELRATGAAEAERIRADADRQREVIVAEAYRDAQRIKGDGDAKAAAIYAGAFSKDPDFYAFYRSMEAYRKAFGGKNDLFLLDPSSAFFKYFKDATGGPPAPSRPSAARK